MGNQARDYSKGIFLPAYDLVGGTAFGYVMIRTADNADGMPQVILPTGTAPWRQDFYGVCIEQGFVGGTGTAALEPITLKRQGACPVILEANQAVTRGQNLIASPTTLGCVIPRTNFSGSAIIIGTAEETLAASTTAQRLEAYLQPYRVEDRLQVSASQPLLNTAIGNATVYAVSTGQAFSVAATALYVARYTGSLIANLGVQLNVAPGGADTVTVTLYTSLDHGATYAARAVTCAIGPTGHSGADLTNTYALTVGEIVAVQIVSTNVTAAGCAISLDIT